MNSFWLVSAILRQIFSIRIEGEREEGRRSGTLFEHFSRESFRVIQPLPPNIAGVRPRAGNVLWFEKGKKVERKKYREKVEAESIRARLFLLPETPIDFLRKF